VHQYDQVTYLKMVFQRQSILVRSLRCGSEEGIDDAPSARREMVDEQAIQTINEKEHQ